MTTVDTAKVTDHRPLHFNTIDDLLVEIDRIVAAERSGTLRWCGNWTPGQVFGHLATWINYGYVGFPRRATPPWFIRPILRMKVKKYLRDGMPRGIKIPGIKEGTFGTEPLTTQEGAQRLEAALMRLKNREPVRHYSPAFGEMPHEQHIAFQLRHAELHLGYLHC